MAAETICEIIFEKAAGTVCCGYKKSFRRQMNYEIYKCLYAVRLFF